MTTPPLADPQPAILLPHSRAIAPLLRRFGAFLIDCFFVGGIGMLIAHPFAESLVAIGPWGRLIGFLIALPYYAIFNSRIGNGQSPGKRLMHLQVVNADGTPISFARALVRSVLFTLPLFLNGLDLPLSRVPRLLLYAESVLIFGLGISTIYLVLFNRATRQSIHDLAAGSYVADAHTSGPVHPIRVWKGHYAVVALVLVFFGIAGPLLESQLTKHIDLTTMLADARLIESLDHVQSVSIMEARTSNAPGSRTYVVSVRYTGPAGQRDALAHTVAATLLAHDPHVREHDQLRINIIRGYELGIADSFVTYPYTDTPEAWQASIPPSTPPR